MKKRKSELEKIAELLSKAERLIYKDPELGYEHLQMAQRLHNKSNDPRKFSLEIDTIVLRYVERYRYAHRCLQL